MGDLIIIILIRNGAKTISLQTTFGRLNNNNNNKKQSKNNKSPKQRLGDLIIIIRNGAKSISLQTTFGRLNKDIKVHIMKCLMNPQI